MITGIVPLQQLKERLQHEFTKTHTSEDYVEAIADGIYSCQYETETPLVQWLKSWEVIDRDSHRFDKRYQKGVKFVSDAWQAIKDTHS
jgi:hypothetical protein